MLHFFRIEPAFPAVCAEKRNFLERRALSCMGEQPELRADCSQCQGLCCIALPFDRSAWFAFDKAADVPCPQLQPSTGCCSIHAELHERGQAGCAAYDCYGAGQRVTRDLLPGVRAADGLASTRRLTQAFRTLRRVHAQLLLLREADRLPLTREHENARARLLDELDPPHLTEQALDRLDIDALEDRVRRFVGGLRGYVSARRLPIASESARHSASGSSVPIRKILPLASSSSTAPNPDTFQSHPPGIRRRPQP